MPTYSRSGASTTTAQSTSPMPSQDISSLLVKTMANVMSNSGEQGSSDNKDFSDIISEGINNSDLLKDKDKQKNDEELNKLLKDQSDKNKEMSNLLKDNVRTTKEQNKSNSKSNSNAAVVASVAAVLKSKSITQAAGKIIGGTGKAAGGLISGIGNLGGAAAAGIGRLFGPVGAMIGKVVGTAIAGPFKLVGGIITKSTALLGTILSTPLKELVTKGALIVVALSQLFVFLEGLIAKFMANKDLKLIDFMSKFKASVALIPDKIKLSLEQILSKVKILGKPIYKTSMSKEDKKELKALEKKDSNLALAQNKLMDQAGRWLGESEASNYDISDDSQREALKQAMLAKTAEQVSQGIMPAISEKEIEKYFSDYEKRAANSKLSDEDIQRMAELRALKERGGRDLNKEKEELETKQAKLADAYRTEGILKDMEKGDWTAYEEREARKMWGDSVVDVAHTRFAGNHDNMEYNYKSATGAEKFLDNQYKAWTDAWGKMFKDLKQDIGININQKVEQRNAVSSR